ncbi:MAG TPA: hypothetical protein VFN35_06885 [Ktedonobacteraceae bacterium]|nr:hypothetical protein [Ktedonobacteraceae bacterium]
MAQLKDGHAKVITETVTSMVETVVRKHVDPAVTTVSSPKVCSITEAATRERAAGKNQREMDALPHENLPHLLSKRSSLLFFVDRATQSQARSWSLTTQKTGGPVNDKRTIVMRHGATKLSL